VVLYKVECTTGPHRSTTYTDASYRPLSVGLSLSQ